MAHEDKRVGLSQNRKNITPVVNRWTGMPESYVEKLGCNGKVLNDDVIV